jgi:hypothetical protein
MQQLFISHVEEDRAFAAEIGGALEQRGFTVWYYERDSIPGPSYLKQVIKAIAECEGVVLIVSPTSMNSHQVDAEVYRAFETKKHFVPVLHGVSHDEFEAQKPDWAMATRAATSIRVPPSGVSSILDQLEQGVKMLGVSPRAPVQAPVPPPAVAKPAGPATERLVWAVFGPEECSPGDVPFFQVLLYAPGQAEEARRMAREADEEAKPYPHAAGEAKELLSRGESVRLEFGMPGLEVDEPAAEVIWDGNPRAVRFVVRVPADSPPAIRLAWAVVSRNGVQLGRPTFALRIKKPDTLPVNKVVPPPRRHHKAYLSYAVEDRQEVLRRAQMLSDMGVSIFADFVDLEPGQDWDQKGLRMIREADAFVLFWSEAASRSKTVRREVDYALKLQADDPGGRREIIPIALSKPMPPPPPGLGSMHFLDTLAYFVVEPEKK